MITDVILFDICQPVQTLGFCTDSWKKKLPSLKRWKKSSKNAVFSPKMATISPIFLPWVQVPRRYIRSRILLFSTVCAFKTYLRCVYLGLRRKYNLKQPFSSLKAFLGKNIAFSATIDRTEGPVSITILVVFSFQTALVKESLFLWCHHCKSDFSQVSNSLQKLLLLKSR